MHAQYSKGYRPTHMVTDLCARHRKHRGKECFVRALLPQAWLGLPKWDTCTGSELHVAVSCPCRLPQPWSWPLRSKG